MTEQTEEGLQTYGDDGEEGDNANGTEDTPEPAASESNPSPSSEGGPPPWQPWVFGAATALLGGFLVDAAVETALAESPLRWWVVGTVVAALASVGLLWKRILWPTRAALLLLFGLGGLTAAAWTSDGLENGVVALGQTTGALMAGAIALLLAVAAALVVAQRFLHPIPAGFLAVLAAYGITAFGLATPAEQSWAQLFHGGALFEQLPFYLQGTVVGALGVLPAVATLELVRGAMRVRGRALRLWGVQLLAIGCGIALALAGFFGYRLDVVLTDSLDESGRPERQVNSFSENAEAIHVYFRSTLGDTAKIEARWIAMETIELEPGSTFSKGSLKLAPGEQKSLSLKGSTAGFSPGRYYLELEVDGVARDRLHFEVTPLSPPLALLEDTEIPRGFNLARDRFGGRIVSTNSEYNDEWAASRLIDGGVLRAPINTKLKFTKSNGWSSMKEAPPWEVVFGFHEGREALIRSVIFNPLTSNISRHTDRLPRHLELWVSKTVAGDDFEKVSVGRMGRVLDEQVMTFDPIRARRAKLRVLSSHGGDSVLLGEVQILEDVSGGSSILHDIERNLALPWLGGVIARMSSQHSPAAMLIDGDETAGGWRSRGAHLPQEIVFAFDDDQEAFVDRVVLVPSTDQEPETWPKTFTLSLSSQDPFHGFTEVGTFNFNMHGGSQNYPVGLAGRFLKLRILENHGGSVTALCEVKILEGSITEQASILFVPPLEEGDWRGRTGGVVKTGALDLDADVESEPNDDPGSANSLRFDRFTRGVIDPMGEDDYYVFDIPDATPVLNIDVEGEPYIRTSLTLLDGTGTAKKSFDPGTRPGSEATLSWQVDPGPHHLLVTEPTISIVLIWDRSGSMEGRTKDLETAVRTYIEQVQPTERLHLMNFDNDPHLFTKDFTNDREVLWNAAEGHFRADFGTAFYEAVQKGIKLLDGVKGNRAIVVMTDGHDSASDISYPQFWAMLEETPIRIYTIGLGSLLENFSPALGNTMRRMLGHVAWASNGRSFFARDSEELSGVYQKIADELRTPFTYQVRPRTSPGPGTLEVVATGERVARVSTPLFELILDASGSMRERKRKVDGRLKMDVAKDIAIQTIEGLPDDATVAFRVYGHRIREGRRGDCQDSELLFPFGRVDKPHLIERIQNIKALGTTPLAYSLLQAARDFGTAPGAKVLILVTDGKEECGGSATEVVEQLVAEGFDLTVNVVGFALAEDNVKQEMKRVAEITGGRFFDAQDAAGLRDAIQKSLAVGYDVLDSEGEIITTGQTGLGSIEVPEGTYTIVMHAAGDPVVIEDVPVRRGEPTLIEVEKEGDEVGVRVVTKPEPVTVPESNDLPEIAPAPVAEPTSEPADDPAVVPGPASEAAARPAVEPGP